MNNKAKKALKEYQDKVRSGEITREPNKNPLEKWNELPLEKQKRSYKAAVYAKCWECSCGQRSEITNCTVKLCPLFVVRPYQRG